MRTAALRVHALRVVLVALGTATSSLGYLVTLAAGMGNGPLFAVHEGLHVRLGISLGVAAAVVGLMLVLAAAVMRAPLGPSTVAIPLLTGCWVDLFEPLVRVSGGPTLRWSAFAAGTVVMMLGAAVALGASAGASAMEGVMLGLSRRLRVKPSTARLVLELTLALVGAGLGGRVGAGTVLMGASVGHLFSFWSRRLQWCGLPLPAWNGAGGRARGELPPGRRLVARRA